MSPPPKYTPEQVHEMAQAALQSRESGDPRWFDLVIRVAFHQNIAPHEVVERIEHLAATRPTNERSEHATC